jgi:hypothetical protein
LAALAFAALLLAGAPAGAALLIAVTEEGGEVVARASGRLNLAALQSDGTASAGPFLAPQSAFLFSGGSVDFYVGATGPGAFGIGGSTDAGMLSGDPFGVFGGAGRVYVPADYQSGAPIEGTLTYARASFTSLGLTPGAYVWRWGAGAAADSLTVQIGPVAVPGPGALAAFGLGLLALGAARAERRRGARCQET